MVDVFDEAHDVMRLEWTMIHSFTHRVSVEPHLCKHQRIKGSKDQQN